MNEFRVLVFGVTDYEGGEKVKSVLNSLGGASFGDTANPSWLPRPDLVILHDGISSVAKHADQWAITNSVPVRVFKPDYETLKDLADTINLLDIIDNGQPHLVLAFSSDKRTKSIIQLARLAKDRIAVEEFDVGDERDQ